jgi:hypothetical protein
MADQIQSLNEEIRKIDEKPRTARSGEEWWRLAVDRFYTQYRYREAVSCFTEAISRFEKEKKIIPGDNYFLPAVAALAAALGKGKDADTLSAAKRQELRRQAQRWLEIAVARTRPLAVADSLLTRLRIHDLVQDWVADPTLRGALDPARWNDLPREERDRWQSLQKQLRQLQSESALAVRNLYP